MSEGASLYGTNSAILPAQPPSLRTYICVVNQDRWPFDFSDNQFKPVKLLGALKDAILYTDGRPEESATCGCLYSVVFDLSRLVSGGDPGRVPKEGAIVSVHWLLQQRDEPDVTVDKRADNCRLRLIGGKFELLDRCSAKQHDEAIPFETRARFAEGSRTTRDYPIAAEMSGFFAKNCIGTQRLAMPQALGILSFRAV